MFLCGVIGIERGIRNRPAGFITYILVGMGATVVMVTNEYVTTVYGGSDPTRMAAQVVSGIGFLGAGTILTTSKNQIRGLTTAAGLWTTAAIGLACGVGFYSGAIMAWLLIMFALTFLRKFDKYIKEHARMMEIFIEYNEEFSVKTLLEYARNCNYEITDMEFGKLKTIDREYGTLSLVMHFKRQVDHNNVISVIKEFKGVNFIREIA